MSRIFVVEIMGRESGFIASQVALACGAEEVLVPEITYDLEIMYHDVTKGCLKDKDRGIIIVAEGEDAKAKEIVKKIAEMTGSETRKVVLGHIQRGGSPTAQDRLLATRFGAAAVDLIINNEFGKAVAVKGNQVLAVDLHFAADKKKGQMVKSSYQLMRHLT